MNKTATAIHASIVSQIDSIIAIETAKESASLVAKLNAEKSRVTETLVSEFIAQTKVKADFFDNAIFRSADDRLAIYALQKLVKAMRALATNSATHCDKYTAMLMRELRDSETVTLDNKRFNALIVSNHIAMSTATTQSSSTRQALRALQVAEYSEHAVTINDSATAAKFVALFAKK